MGLFGRKPKLLAKMSDKELIALAKEDKEAFGELYERYVTKIL